MYYKGYIWVYFISNIQIKISYYFEYQFQNEQYKERTKTWKNYTREEKSDLIMKYVDDITLLEKNKVTLQENLKKAKFENGAHKIIQLLLTYANHVKDKL